MPDLPGTFGHYPTMTDGLGGMRHCLAHPKFDLDCERCIIADRLNHGASDRRRARVLKPRKRPKAHDNPGAFCRCQECWSKMKTIAEGIQ